MSSDSLALLTDVFSEPLVRAIMCRTQDNYEQKKIFTKIKSSYKRWKKDTDFLWGPMPQMEVYPNYMNKMQLDVESGMIITEDGSIPAPLKKPFKAPYVPGLGSMFQEIYEKTHPALTDNPPIKERVHNISTKKPAKTQETAQLQARIAELEAEIASLKQQLEECQNNDSYNDEQEAKQDEKVLYNKVSHEFFLRLLENAGLDLDNTGNKTRVGDLWHMVTGKSGDEIRRYCSTRNYINSHTRVDIKRLNELLQDMMIGDFQLPIS